MGLSIFLQACSRPVEPEQACNFVQGASKQRVSWEGRLPIKLYLHNSIPQEAYAAIDRAIDEYNLKLGRGTELFRVVARGVSGDLNPKRDGYNMIYWFTSWDANRPTEQARTTIHWSGSTIFEADMRINADPNNFRYYMGSDPTFSGVDLQSLIVHELGHVLGLAHNTISGSVMNTTLKDSQERRELGKVDMESLECEY